MIDQNLALFVLVLDNSSRTILTKTIPDIYARLLQHLAVLYKIGVTSSRYPPIHTAKRTTSKESMDNIPDHLGFRIVITIEKHVIGCFEIGGHKTRRL